MGSHIIIIMTKRNIIIVNCGSTSINFVEDVLNRGYNPIFLDTRPIDSEEGQKFGELVFTSHAHIKNVELIHEQESYEDTLELVRQYDPLFFFCTNVAIHNIILTRLIPKLIIVLISIICPPYSFYSLYLL